MFCSQCGAKVLDGAKFCQSCGASVLAVKVSSQITVNAQAIVDQPKESGQASYKLQKAAKTPCYTGPYTAKYFYNSGSMGFLKYVGIYMGSDATDSEVCIYETDKKGKNKKKILGQFNRKNAVGYAKVKIKEHNLGRTVGRLLALGFGILGLMAMSPPVIGIALLVFIVSCLRGSKIEGVEIQMRNNQNVKFALPWDTLDLNPAIGEIVYAISHPNDGIDDSVFTDIQ